MDRKKLCTYAAAAAGIIVISILMPKIISAGADLIARRISPVAVEEMTESGVMEAAALGSGMGNETKISEKGEAQESGPESGQADAKERNDAALQEGKAQTDDALTSYRMQMAPQVTEARAGLMDVFIDDREQTFLDALSDYLYSNYGNIYEVTKVSLISFIAENDNEITCQVQVFADNGRKEYMEYYYCSYNRKYDFYSVYAYHE